MDRLNRPADNRRVSPKNYKDEYRIREHEMLDQKSKGKPFGAGAVRRRKRRQYHGKPKRIMEKIPAKKKLLNPSPPRCSFCRSISSHKELPPIPHLQPWQKKCRPNGQT